MEIGSLPICLVCINKKSTDIESGKDSLKEQVFILRVEMVY
jgi:hypothetical protein